MNTIDTKFPVRKNMQLDVLFRFLSCFTITDGLFVLFLTKKGLPLWEIGLLEGIFHLTSILSEVPSGALADLWGRKWVLLLSRLCAAASALVMIATDNFWLLAVGFVFTSWSYNLLSGSEDALVYDTLLQGNQQDSFFRYNSRLSFLAEVSNGLALLLGGFLAEISYTLCYTAVILVNVLAATLCLFFSEPRSTEKRLTVKGHFAASFSLIRGDKKLQFLLLHYGILFGFNTAVFLYSQEYLHTRGLTESRIGIILLCISVCNSLGALFSEKLGRRLGSLSPVICGLAAALGITMMSLSFLPLALLGYALSSMCNAALYPIQSNSLNLLIPSAQRATLISVNSMFFSSVMIALFPLMGAVMEWAGMGSVISSVGVILFVYVLATGKKCREYNI